MYTLQIRDLNTCEIIISNIRAKTILEVIKKYDLAGKSQSHLQLEEVPKE